MSATVTIWNKGKAPEGTTGWNLTPDIRAGLESMNVVVPVATQAERDGLTPPSGKYAGLTVARLDLPGCPLETWDGAKWPVSNSSWALLPMAQAFNHHNSDGWSGLKFAVRDGWVIVTGAVSRPTPWNTGDTCAVVPATLRPATRIQGTNNAYVGPEGNVSVAAGSGAVSFSLTWPLF